MRFFWIIIFLFLILQAKAGERRALKLLEKKDFDKLEEVLAKDLGKDSLNAGTYYIYSLLYNDSLYSRVNLDTAYYYIQKAQALYPSMESKDRKKLNKFNISDSTMLEHKKKLDLQGYERAKILHTIADYNYYIEYFSTSTYVNEAIQDRNALAYEFAEQENTYQSYYRFMQEYPDSRQYKTAKENYDRLLFEDQIKEGTLQKYEQFIVRYPESPFLSMAIKNIYELKTSTNSKTNLVEFIREFPESEHVRDAIDRLYHNHISLGKSDFAYDFSFLPLDDSIRLVDKYADAILIPVFENNQYGFITIEGEMIIPYRYEDLDNTYLCGNIQQDFLIVKKDNRSVIISKTGALIYDGPFHEVQDMGYGLLKISDQVKYGIIYKTGKGILPVEFDEIERLDDQFIKVKQNREWQLYSMNGLLLTDDYYQEIRREGYFLLFKKAGKWAITLPENFFRSYIQDNISLNFIYDDYELIEPTQILCFLDERETVLDKNLEERIPLNEQQIYTLPDGWIVKQESLYHIYDDAFYKISGSGFEKIEYKGKWISGKLEDKWILYYNYAPFPDVFAYDSINILSDQYVLGQLDESYYLIFTNLKRQELTDHKNIQILQYRLSDGFNDSSPAFLMVDLDRGRKSIFNHEGKEIVKGDFDNIQAIAPEYLIIQKRGKVGLTDTTGQVLLKTQYDAIANYEEGFVSVLNQKKFGLYNKHLNLFVIPRYDRLIKVYNRGFLIVHDKNGYGIIDMERNDVTENDFDEIVYWNDTAMLGKRDNKWYVYDLKNGQYLLEDIDDFDYLKDQDEKIIIYHKEDHYGVLNNQRGILINHTFNDIVNLGSNHHPVFFAEKFIPEAEFYIVIYYDESGEILRKQVFDESEYDKIYCN
jgi:hypothetical protein